MKDTKNTPIVSKNNLIPFILVTSLFALWGFANAVTDPMVQAFKKVLELQSPTFLDEVSVKFGISNSKENI